MQDQVNELTAKKVLAALPAYLETLQPERRHFFAQYKAADVGFRVVGTGSVGTRDYVVLMFGGATAGSAVSPIEAGVAIGLCALSAEERRAASTTANVWWKASAACWCRPTSFWDGRPSKNRPYLVRQLRDHKAGIECSDLEGKGLAQYAEVCGELLAKGHARSGDPCMLSGYLGTSERFD